ncbi:MAG: hypothetical protein ACK5KL_09165 [Dysgonomonas sp.]
MKIIKYEVIKAFALDQDLYIPGDIIYIDEYCMPSSFMSKGGHYMFKENKIFDGAIQPKTYEEIKPFLEIIE